jgi:hypothetical protein
MEWQPRDDPWPELITTVTGRVTGLEPGTDGAARAWVDSVGPLHLSGPELAARLALGRHVRVAYHREAGALMVDAVRPLG